MRACDLTCANAFFTTLLQKMWSTWLINTNITFCWLNINIVFYMHFFSVIYKWYPIEGLYIYIYIYIYNFILFNYLYNYNYFWKQKAAPTHPHLVRYVMKHLELEKITLSLNKKIHFIKSGKRNKLRYLLTTTTKKSGLHRHTSCNNLTTTDLFPDCTIKDLYRRPRFCLKVFIYSFLSTMTGDSRRYCTSLFRICPSLALSGLTVLQ